MALCKQIKMKPLHLQLAKMPFRTGIELHVRYDISLGYLRETKDFLRTFNTESNFFM